MKARTRPIPFVSFADVGDGVPGCRGVRAFASRLGIGLDRLRASARRAGAAFVGDLDLGLALRLGTDPEATALVRTAPPGPSPGPSAGAELVLPLV